MAIEPWGVSADGEETRVSAIQELAVSGWATSRGRGASRVVLVQVSMPSLSRSMDSETVEPSSTCTAPDHEVPASAAW